MFFVFSVKMENKYNEVKKRTEKQTYFDIMSNFYSDLDNSY